MPCNSDGFVDNTIPMLRKELDTVTKHLCEVMKSWEKTGYPFRVSGEAKKWFQEHKAADRQKDLDEKKEKEYQAKLAKWESERPKRK